MLPTVLFSFEQKSDEKALTRATQTLKTNYVQSVFVLEKAQIHTQFTLPDIRLDTDTDKD